MDILTPFMARVAEKLAALKDRVTFSTNLSSDPANAKFLERTGQLAKVRGVVVTPEEDWDEEALPAFKLEFSDKVILDAFAEEIASLAPAWQDLLATVIAAFQASRTLGFAGPNDLQQRGTQDQKQLFALVLNIEPLALDADQARDMLERALALGFDSIKAMIEHEAWLRAHAGPAYLRWLETVIGVVPEDRLNSSAVLLSRTPSIISPTNAEAGLYFEIQVKLETKMGEKAEFAKRLAKKHGFNPEGRSMMGPPVVHGLDTRTHAVWFYDKLART